MGSKARVHIVDGREMTVGEMAEALGMKREIRVDFIPEPKIGDYVIVHAGFAIERLGETQALEDLEAWEEMRDVL